MHNPIKAKGQITMYKGYSGYSSLPDIDDRYVFKFSDDVEIKKGQRVAQITLLEHKGYLFGINTEDEREGGFGSTDKKEVNNGNM